MTTQEIQALFVRSIKEAHCFVALHPCTCGAADKLVQGTLSFVGNRIKKVHEWSCSGCQSPRSFTFVYPPDDAHLGVEGYGPPDQPSAIIDAGEFLSVSDFFARRAPASPATAEERTHAAADLQEAIWALEEILKFIGPDIRDIPPESALRSPASQQFLVQLPGQFQRFRLEARLKVYRKLLQQQK